MATQTANETSQSVLWDVYRSVNNQYWYFTFAPMSTSTFGATLAAASGGWNWTVWGLMVLFWYVIHSGMNAIYLSAEDVNIAADSTVQRTVGVSLVGIGVGMGVTLASMTTWLFLILLVLMTFLGFAYTREWFDGLFHHRDRATGVATLPTTMRLIPVMPGYLLLSGTVSLGAILAGLARPSPPPAIPLPADHTRRYADDLRRVPRPPPRRSRRTR
jgi:hypothetical protein